MGRVCTLFVVVLCYIVICLGNHFSFSAGWSAFNRLSMRGATPEDASGGANQYVSEERDTVAATEAEDKPLASLNEVSENFPSAVSNEEPPPTDEQAQSFELLDNIDLKVCFFYH